MSVTDKDLGWGHIKDNVKQLNNMVVTVGHHSNSGRTKDGDMTLAELMAIHEYGSPKISLPATPIYKRTFEDRQKRVLVLQRKLMRAVLLGAMTAKEAGKMLGAYYEGELKNTFTRVVFKNPNYGKRFSPNYTKRPSGAKVTASSRRLIDTGNIRNAIAYKVA